MKKVVTIGFLPAALLLGSGALHSASIGAYLGAGAGFTHLNTPNNQHADSNRIFAGRLFAGYNFINYFGLELDYYGLERTKYTSTLSSLYTGEYLLDAVSLVGKVYFPLEEQSPLNIYGLAGAAQLKGKYKLKVNGMPVHPLKDSALVPTGGVGATYDFSQQLTGGLEVSVFAGKKADQNLGIPICTTATLSLAYRI